MNCWDVKFHFVNCRLHYLSVVRDAIVFQRWKDTMLSYYSHLSDTVFHPGLLGCPVHRERVDIPGCRCHQCAVDMCQCHQDVVLIEYWEYHSVE